MRRGPSIEFRCVSHQAILMCTCTYDRRGGLTGTLASALPSLHGYPTQHVAIRETTCFNTCKVELSCQSKLAHGSGSAVKFNTTITVHCWFYPAMYIVSNIANINLRAHTGSRLGSVRFG